MGWARDERGVSGMALGAAVVVAAALIAIPLVLAARSQQERATRSVGALDRAEGVAADANLTLAVRAATSYFAEQGGFQGLDPGAAAAIEPGIRWNGSPTAVRGEVSIRAASRGSVVLVTADRTGSPTCAAVVGTSTAFGAVDAPTPETCRP